MSPRALEELKSLARRLLDAYVLTPILTALPPLALWTFARDFVSSSHTVPGWATLIASALAGLLVVSVVFNVAHWYRQRRRRRRNLVVVAHGGLSGCRWTAGPANMAMAIGVFDITNITPTGVTVPRVILEISRPLLGVVPRRLRFPAPLGIDDVIGAGNTLRNLQLRFDLQPSVASSAFRARVVLVDNFGAHNYGPWEIWEKV
jgi:hypothetical protein